MGAHINSLIFWDKQISYGGFDTDFDNSKFLSIKVAIPVVLTVNCMAYLSV